MRQRLAFLISRILGPLPLICLLWLTVAVKSGIGFWRAIWVYSLIFVVTIGIPMSITTALVATRRVKDIEWSDIKQRQKYMPALTTFAVASLIILSKLLIDGTVFHLSLVLSVIILAMMLIWSLFNFKISGHIVIATCTFMTINLYFHLKFIWLFLLLFPIIWARKTLKMHTFAELAAGIILPMAISLAAVIIFGYPNIP